jgi:hypothetical protein
MLKQYALNRLMPQVSGPGMAGPEIRHRIMHLAESVMQRVPDILSKRGLEPAFQNWMLTDYSGMSLLFGVLDVGRLTKLEAYMDKNILHQLSTELGGLPVYLSNSSGLRYVVLLNQKPSLPRKVEYPGDQAGYAMLGMNYLGKPVAVKWEGLGHMIVAGMTRSGKSTFLRLLAYQALQNGSKLAIADRDGVTFPMLEGNPALIAPLARSAQEAARLLERINIECDVRAEAYASVSGYPETLDEYNQMVQTPLPRVLVILDEFNATVTELGGVRAEFASLAARLSWRARKFGIEICFAAQEFSKATIGQIRDQVSTSICFRVLGAETARNIRCSAAVRIPEGRAGLAVTDRWGPLQSYYLPKQAMIEFALGAATPKAAVKVDEEPSDIERLAESIRQTWLSNGGQLPSKRKIAQGLGKSYGGGFADKLDQAIALLAATSSTTTSNDDEIDESGASAEE